MVFAETDLVQFGLAQQKASRRLHLYLLDPFAYQKPKTPGFGGLGGPSVRNYFILV